MRKTKLSEICMLMTFVILMLVGCGTSGPNEKDVPSSSDSSYSSQPDSSDSEKTSDSDVSSGIASTGGTSRSFTNDYGTATTICAHSGCTNYIASSGDANCCTTHSNMFSVKWKTSKRPRKSQQ